MTKTKIKHGADIVSGADRVLKKIGLKGLPELHLYNTSGKKYLYCGENSPM